jgi:hypothetical protein
MGLYKYTCYTDRRATKSQVRKVMEVGNVWLGNFCGIKRGKALNFYFSKLRFFNKWMF